MRAARCIRQKEKGPRLLKPGGNIINTLCETEVSYGKVHSASIPRLLHPSFPYRISRRRHRSTRLLGGVVVEDKEEFLRVSKNSGECVNLYHPPKLLLDNLKRVKQAHLDEKRYPISWYALSSITLDGALRFFMERPEIKSMMAAQIRFTRVGPETPKQVRAILEPISEKFPIDLPAPFKDKPWKFYAPVQTYNLLQSMSAGLGSTDTALASLMICATLANLRVTFNTDTKKIVECIDLFLSQVQVRANIAEALLDRFEGVSYPPRAESWIARFGV